MTAPAAASHRFENVPAGAVCGDMHACRRLSKVAHRTEHAQPSVRRARDGQGLDERHHLHRPVRKLFLAVLIELFSCQAVAWSVPQDMARELVIASNDYRDMLTEHGIMASIGGRGQSWATPATRACSAH